MLSLKNIQNIRLSSEKRANPKEEKFNQLYNQGISLIESFIKTYNHGFLKEAANKFIEASKIVKSNPETYFFLSYIFYILGDLKIAAKYLKVCTLINPGLKGTDKLKKLIYENSALGINIAEIKKENDLSIENKITNKTGIQRVNRITKV